MRAFLIVAVAFSATLMAGYVPGAEWTMDDYAKSCEAKNATDCNRVGTYYVGLTITALQRDDRETGHRNEKQAESFYKKACDLSDALGCTQLGQMYLGDMDFTGSDASKKAYEKGCDLGSGDACESVAILYKNGANPNSELEDKYNQRAVALFRKGCDAQTSGSTSGNVQSPCTQLAYMYHEGLGVRKDLDQAKQLSDKACKAGDKYGCEFRGRMDH